MAKATVSIELPEIKLEKHTLYLIGTAPLIVHAFPEKARKQMLDKQMKIAQGGKDARDPIAEFEASRYRLPDGRDGFPAVGFKAAAVTACTSIADVTKVAARQAFGVPGIPMQSFGVLEGSYVRTALIPLVTTAPMMREDVVRLSGPGRTPEMRYRPEYPVWGVELHITLNPQGLSIGQLATMFRIAGHGVGIGDYRPERDGDCGTFELAESAKEFAEWAKDNGLQYESAA